MIALRPWRIFRSIVSKTSVSCLISSFLRKNRPAVREAALATLGQYDSPSVATLILLHYGQLSPAERLKATEVLLRRGPWALGVRSIFGEGQCADHDARPESYCPTAKLSVAESTGNCS